MMEYNPPIREERRPDLQMDILEYGFQGIEGKFFAVKESERENFWKMETYSREAAIRGAFDRIGEKGQKVPSFRKQRKLARALAGEAEKTQGDYLIRFHEILSGSYPSEEQINGIDESDPDRDYAPGSTSLHLESHVLTMGRNYVQGLNFIDEDFQKLELLEEISRSEIRHGRKEDEERKNALELFKEGILKEFQGQYIEWLGRIYCISDVSLVYQPKFDLQIHGIPYHKGMQTHKVVGYNHLEKRCEPHEERFCFWEISSAKRFGETQLPEFAEEIQKMDKILRESFPEQYSATD